MLEAHPGVLCYKLHSFGGICLWQQLRAPSVARLYPGGARTCASRWGGEVRRLGSTAVVQGQGNFFIPSLSPLLHSWGLLCCWWGRGGKVSWSRFWDWWGGKFSEGNEICNIPFVPAAGVFPAASKAQSCSEVLGEHVWQPPLLQPAEENCSAVQHGLALATALLNSKRSQSLFLLFPF